MSSSSLKVSPKHLVASAAIALAVVIGYDKLYKGKQS